MFTNFGIRVGIAVGHRCLTDSNINGLFLSIFLVVEISFDIVNSGCKNSALKRTKSDQIYDILDIDIIVTFLARAFLANVLVVSL